MLKYEIQGTMQKSNITRTAEIIMGQQKNGEMSGHISTLTPSHPPDEAASMTKSLAKRTKRHRSCRVITPSSDPFSLSRRGLISLIVLPTFLRAENLKTRRLEDLTTGFLFSKGEQDPPDYFITPSPPTSPAVI